MSDRRDASLTSEEWRDIANGREDEETVAKMAGRSKATPDPVGAEVDCAYCRAVAAFGGAECPRHPEVSADVGNGCNTCTNLQYQVQDLGRVASEAHDAWTCEPDGESTRAKMTALESMLNFCQDVEREHKPMLRRERAIPRAENCSACGSIDAVEPVHGTKLCAACRGKASR